MHVYTSQKPYIKAVVYAMSDLDNQPNSTDVVSQEVWIESCNKCAPGPDDVSNELFKGLLFLAQSINAIVQHHITQEALDEGILVALPTSLILGGGGAQQATSDLLWKYSSNSFGISDLCSPLIGSTKQSVFIPPHGQQQAHIDQLATSIV